MRRAGRRIWSEWLPVGLILASLAGTLGLVVAMHQQAALVRAPKPVEAAPTVVVTPDPEPIEAESDEPELPPPSPVVVIPPEDLTQPILASLAAKQAEEEEKAARAKRQLASLETARKQADAESERWRDREKTVHAQLADLSTKADRLDREVDALARQRDVLARELDATKAALMKARAKNGGYAVMPHKSANGTWQRPVILECRDGKAVLQPRGIGFSMMDMSPFLETRSPLVIGVANELVLAQRAGSPDGSIVVPYIYFVVRPDGIRPFYEARGTLEKLGIAFGYELVDQDWEIDFPNYDDMVAWDGPNATKPKGPGSGSAGASNACVWPAERPGGVGGNGSGKGSGDNPFVWPTARRGSGNALNGLDSELATLEAGGGRPGAGGNGLAGNDPSGAFDRGGGLGGAGSRGGRASLPPRGQVGGTAPPNGLVPLDPSTVPGFDQPGGNGESGSGREVNPGANGGGPLRYGTPGGRQGVVRPSAGDGRDQNDRFSGPVNHGSRSLPDDGRIPIDPRQIALAAEAEEDAELGQGKRGAPSGFDGAPPPPLASSGSESGTGTGAPPTASRSYSNRNGSPSGQPPNGSSASGIGLPSSGTPTSSPGIAQPPQGITLQTANPSNAPGSEGSGPSSNEKPRDSKTKPMPPQRRYTIQPEQPVEIPLDLTVTCTSAGIVIHPGGYRITLETLRKENVLQTDLQTIVRNHEIMDPMVKPKPRLEFLIEPGGAATFQIARKQTTLADVKWPTTIRVAEGTTPWLFSKERF